MKAFVSGATGFVGSAVCRALRREDIHVTGLTSKSKKTGLLEERGIHPLVGDMRDASVVAPAAAEAEVTILCAQLAFGTRFTKADMLENARAEMLHVKAAVQGAALQGSRVIYTAGYLVFGAGEDGWTAESCGFDPPAFSEGGVAATRWLLEAVKAKRIKGGMIAPGFVYGPGGMFAEMASQIHAGKFAVPGGGKFHWSPVHVDDLARAYVAALEGKADGKSVLVVDDEPMLMRDIMFTIADELGVKHPRSVPKFMAKLFLGSAMVDGITTSRRCRNTLAKELLGWKPRHPRFRDGVPGVLKELALC
jgi:nucleoside-diphosphate-sugar epimerase